MKTFKSMAAFGLLAGAVTLHATTYWVDSVNGNDSNNGTSGPSEAWKSMATADSRWGTHKYPLNPGDHIELANGSTWYWPVELTGVQGANGNNILIQNYKPADGNTTQPLIYAQNLYCGVQLWNCSFITVEGITVNGYNTASHGVYVYATNYVSSGIIINGLTVENTFHRGTGSYSPSTAGGDGVYVHPVSAGRVDNITIENSVFKNVNYGIEIDPPWGGSWWPWGFAESCSNVLVENIDVSQNDGGWDGLFCHNCKYVNFQNSTVTGAEASWMQDCEYYLAHNIVGENANDLTDGTGIHIDYDNAYVTIEDCFFANNSGGFVEILPGCYNCCFRYNISFNDGDRILGQNGAGQNGKSLWIASNCRNIYIYNNMISVSNFVSNMSLGTNINALVQNNVFNYVGGTQGDSQFGNNLIEDGVADSVVSDNNCTPDGNGGYYGVAGLSGPALFYAPDINQYGNATASGLQNAGVDVGLVPGDKGVASGAPGPYTGLNNPTEDVWGHATDLTAPNVGGVQ